MTHVITDECIKCKYTDCVEVCPADCFYEGELMLVIDPDKCIDCGICIPMCPVGAIKTETKELIDWIKFAKLNSQIWPNITLRKAPLADADKHKYEKDKIKYITEKNF